MRLNTRLGLGVGLLVLFGVGVAAFGVVQLVGVGHQADRMSASAEDLRRLLTVESLLGSVREAEIRYQLSDDATALITRRDLEARIAATLAGSPRLRQATAALRGALADHDGSFDTLRDFRVRAAAARRSLLTSGDRLSALGATLLTQARASKDPAVTQAAADVERSLLLMRVASWRFLAATSLDGNGAFEATVDDAAEAISNLDGATNGTLKTWEDPVSDALDGYKDLFDSYGDLVMSSAEFTRDHLQPQIAAMAASAAVAEKRLTAEFRTASLRGHAIIRTASVLQTILALSVLVLGSLIAATVARSVVRPLRAITDVLRRLASGDNATPIPARDRADEIGDIARAAEIFRQTAVEREDLARTAEADTARRAERAANRARALEAFRTDIGAVVASLSMSSNTLQTTARHMSANAGETTAQAQSVTQAAERASGGVALASVAAGQLAASVGEISHRLTDAVGMIARAAENARRTDAIVGALSARSLEIRDVVALIDGIAARTNLLALNATIEAARAGEAGRGFAVVAAEVKDLARQTLDATGSVNDRIAQIQDATRQAVEAMSAIAASVEDVSAITTAISAAVEQQGAATEEIARSVSQTAESADVVKASIVVVRETAGSTGHAAHEVLDAAGHLSERAAQLSAEVNRLDEALRAA